MNRVQVVAWDAQTQIDARDLRSISRTVGKTKTRLIVDWSLLWHLRGGVVVVGRSSLVVVHDGVLKAGKEAFEDVVGGAQG